jgi:hypothetical protein
MHSINTVQTHGGSQYHCFPQPGVGSGAGEDRPHERNSWACEIARRCQRDCPIERVAGIEIDSESGSRLFCGWQRQTDIGHCSPWRITHCAKKEHH